MRSRTRNTGVAIMANSSTMAMRNAEAADGSPEVSYAAVVASPRRSTRSTANVSLSQKSGNARVADPVEQSKASPPPSPERARPVPADDEDFAANLRSKEQEIVALKEEIAKRDVVLKGPKISVSTEAAVVCLRGVDCWRCAVGVTNGVWTVTSRSLGMIKRQSSGTPEE